MTTGDEAILPNLLSCDLEDWFHSENLRRRVPLSAWDRCETRIEASLQTTLKLLDEAGALATFFVLGWVAERLPHLVRTLQERGHEIASHGTNHQLIYTQTREEFKEDVHRAKAVVEGITGAPVLGYRAPTFSITEWALDILVEEGFKYDSSVMLASVHDRYGTVHVPEGPAPYLATEIRPGLIEIPLSSVSTGPVRLPWGGGGYFRLLPYWVYNRGVSRLGRSGEALRFYFHPWELDGDQPRVAGITAFARFRHYTGLRGMPSKLKRLLREHTFATFSSVLGD